MKLPKVICPVLCGMTLIFSLSLVTACAKKQPPPVERRQIVVSKPAPVPEGVIRYCWEEPMVRMEQNGPGLDTEGKWYHPSYTAVREVRQGRWRPCRVQEGAGATK